MLPDPVRGPIHTLSQVKVYTPCPGSHQHSSDCTSPLGRVCGASWMCPPGNCTPHWDHLSGTWDLEFQVQTIQVPLSGPMLASSWDQFVVVKCVDGPWVHMMQFATCVCTGLLLVQNGAGVRREVGRSQGPRANPPTLPCSGKELLIVWEF